MGGAMKFLGRLLGWLLLLGALAALAYDLWRAWQSGSFELLSAGKLWFALHKNSLQLLEPALVRHVWEPLWDPVMLTLLQWPAAAVLAVPGLVLLILCRRRGGILRRVLRR